jgi:hemolysin III
LLAALASGLLLLLAGFLLATATLLTALTRLLLLLTGILTAATLLAALAWILVSHDLDSPAGKFPQRTTFVPQVRSSTTNSTGLIFYLWQSLRFQNAIWHGLCGARRGLPLHRGCKLGGAPIGLRVELAPVERAANVS